MPTYEYYGTRGLGPKHKMPAGVFRIVKTEDELWYEQVTMEGEWLMDNELVRYIAGYADDAEPISKKLADEFIAYLKSGQAVIDKENGTWK